MNNRLVYLILFVFPLIFSCGEEKVEAEIEPDVFAEILFDIHLLDGIIEVERLQDKSSKTDFYEKIYKKHGVSKEDFANTVSLYMRYPEQYAEIYGKVKKRNDSLLATLKEDKKHKNKKDKKTQKSIDIWNQKTIFKYPPTDPNYRIRYDIPVKIKEPALFTLSADVLRFPDDKTIKPSMRLRIHYEDGTIDKKKRNFPKLRNRKIPLSVHLQSDPKKKIRNLTGYVSYRSKDTKKSHIIVSNIKLLQKNKIN